MDTMEPVEAKAKKLNSLLAVGLLLFSILSLGLSVFGETYLLGLPLGALGIVFSLVLLNRPVDKRWPLRAALTISILALLFAILMGSGDGVLFGPLEKSDQLDPRFSSSV